MKKFVVDTSALIRLYVPDGPIPVGFEQAVERATQGEEMMLAPELIWAETAQVLWKKEQAGSLSTTDVNDILTAIAALPMDSMPHALIVESSLTIARLEGVTIYDALYLALAKDEGAHLFSADAEMLRAAKRLGLDA